MIFQSKMSSDTLDETIISIFDKMKGDPDLFVYFKSLLNKEGYEEMRTKLIYILK